VMKGDPSANAVYELMKSNEQEHASDYKRASDQFLVPDHQAVLALRGTGADANACGADLNTQFSRLTTDNVARFVQRVRTDIAGRDVPGGHKFSATYQERNDCDNLSIVVKKMPAPPAGRRR